MLQDHQLNPALIGMMLSQTHSGSGLPQCGQSGIRLGDCRRAGLGVVSIMGFAIRRGADGSNRACEGMPQPARLPPAARVTVRTGIVGQPRLKP